VGRAVTSAELVAMVVGWAGEMAEPVATVGLLAAEGLGTSETV